MAEAEKLIAPVRSVVDTKCYPLMRREAYVFEDNSRLIRNIPYYRPNEELFVDQDGSIQYVSPQEQSRAEVLKLVRELAGCAGIDQNLRYEYSQIFNAAI